MLEKENIGNLISNDLDRRNRNWDAINIRNKSELGEEHIIRELPNGVKDEFNEGNFINRTSKTLLDGDLSWDQVLDATGTYRGRVSKWAMENNAALQVEDSGIGQSDDGNYIITSTAPGSGVSNKRIGFVLDHVYVYVEKTKVDLQLGSTLIEKFKNYLYLYPIRLTYQLATLIEIPLPEPMTPNTREIVRLSEQVDKLTSVINTLIGG